MCKCSKAYMTPNGMPQQLLIDNHDNKCKCAKDMYISLFADSASRLYRQQHSVFLGMSAPCRTIREAATHQGVVVLNLLHGRLSRQGKLDDLKVVQLLRRGSTAATNKRFSMLQS